MYLRLDESFATHPKTMMFVGRMQDPNAAMYLVKLWTWAVRSAPTGDLSEMLPWSIENVVGYRLQDGKCYAAMAACGFIEEQEPGAPLAIHNWAKRTGGDIAKMETEAQRKRNYRAAKPWDVLRLEILTRDVFSCKDCGRKPDDQSDLEVHHVIPLRKFEDKIAGNSPSNLRTLCSRCHDKAEAAYRQSEKEDRTADGRRTDGGPTDDQTAPGTADTGKARQVQDRSGSVSLSSRGSVCSVSSRQTHAKSNSGADGLAILPPRTRHPIARVGTLTPAFNAVFERYPRGDKRMEAAQIFSELADDYPGGEAALSVAILAAFDAGMLKRHPYHGPNATRPCLDAVLANRRWEDPPSAPDDLEPPKPRLAATSARRDLKVGHHAAEVKPRPEGVVDL